MSSQTWTHKVSSTTPMLTATCWNCKTIQISSYDGGQTWTHMPMNAEPCWIVRPGMPEDAVATPWPQGDKH